MSPRYSVFVSFLGFPDRSGHIFGLAGCHLKRYFFFDLRHLASPPSFSLTMCQFVLGALLRALLTAPG